MQRQIRIRYEVQGTHNGNANSKGARCWVESGSNRKFMTVTKFMDTIKPILEKEGWTSFAVLNWAGDIR